VIIQGKIPGSEAISNIYVEGEVITRIAPHTPAVQVNFGGPNLYIFPGFFDPQVNGFAGVDFNGLDLNREGLHRAAVGLSASGVTSFLPTLTTAPFAKTLAGLKILSEVMDFDPLWQGMAIGIHLEGPYISPEEGFRGAHPPEFIRPPKWEEFEKFQEAGRGHIRCLTLAPELEGAIPFIERAAQNGIVVGLGHTNASEEILEEAVRAGAKISCHLGNGAQAFLPRHRNPINKQLAMDGLMASIIVDGIHLPDYVVKNFIRVKGIERILLTTDSMAGAGAPPGRYTIGDLEVEVGINDRSAHFSGTPYLAGSTLTMDQAVNNAMRFANLSLGPALRMAGENGGKLFPEAKKDIIPGSPADIVLFEYKEELRINGTWIRGEKIFPHCSHP
jgi:N-acetylglucosamine-6-phosphate deacetylase